MNPNQQPNHPPRVVLTEQDKLKCECGCDVFQPVVTLYFRKNPLIGQQDYRHAANEFACLKCQKVFVPK
jgi:hypothetical protein